MKKTTLVILLSVMVQLYSACLGHSPGEVYFEAYTKDSNGYYTVPALYRTRDYGQTAQVVIADFNGFIHRDAKPGSFYHKIPGGGFYYSPDTCQSWVLRTPAYTSFQSGTHEGEIWAGVGYLSQNFGQSWSAHPLNGLDTYADSWSPGISLGELYVFTHSKKLYRSTDYGNNFTFVSDISIPNTTGVSSGWQQGELLLTTFVSAANEVKKYRSTDYGMTFSYLCQIPWHQMSKFLKGYNSGEFYSTRIDRLNHPYYTDMIIKSYHTTDFGQTWDSVQTSYQTGIEDNEQLTIDNFQLVNYPNPFNNATVVSYQLPAGGNIDLSVYNARGELVKCLYQGQLAAGRHTKTFNAGGLNSGIYYLRLTGKNIDQTKKCILLK